MCSAPAPGFSRLCVYCGSAPGHDLAYGAMAAALGKACAEKGVAVVYGGGRAGLMGVLADAALAHGGEVIGVIPEFLKDMEVAHGGLSALYLTKTMQERQSKMAELSEAFVMLPGGLGTLAEFFEIVTWRQLGLHDKPIYILNGGGYWDGFLDVLAHIRRNGFMRNDPATLYKIVPDIERIFAREY